MQSDNLNPIPPASLRVLVVEDERRLRDLLVEMIPTMGYPVSAAASAEEALRLQQAQEHPIVLLDLQLPLMGGMELFKTLRQRWPATQVIVLSGFGDLESARAAIHLDVVEFLGKPFHLRQIEMALERARQRLQEAGISPALAAAVAEESAAVPAGSTLADAERQQILAALDRHNGNRTAAAAELGISRRTLHYRLRDYRRLGLLPVLLLMLGGIGLLTGVVRASAKVDEKQVGSVTGAVQYAISPHGVHLATVSHTTAGWVATVDGVAGPVFERIVQLNAYLEPRPTNAASQSESRPGIVIFNKDGKHFAYLACRSAECVVIEDNKEFMRLPIKGADGTTVGGNADIRLEFTGDDGNHLLLARSTTHGFELWVDKQKMPGTYALDGKGTGLSGSLTFSPDGQHIAVVGIRTPDNRSGLFLDDRSVYTQKMNSGIRHLSFTPDSRHLFWMALEPAQGKNSGPYEEVIYLDGRPVVRCGNVLTGSAARIFDAAGPASQPSSVWEMRSDGVLSCLVPMGDVVKRLTITPPDNTSIFSMLADLNPANSQAASGRPRPNQQSAGQQPTRSKALPAPRNLPPVESVPVISPGLGL